MPSRIVVITNDNAELSYNMNDTKFMGSFIEDLTELCDDDVLKVSVPFSKNELKLYVDDYKSGTYFFIFTGIGAFFNNGVDYISGMLACDNLIECNEYDHDLYEKFDKFCDSSEYCRKIRDYVKVRHVFSHDIQSNSFLPNINNIYFEGTLARYVHGRNIIMDLKQGIVSIYPHKSSHRSNNENYINSYDSGSINVYHISSNILICLYEICAFIFYTNDCVYFMTSQFKELDACKFYDSTQEIIEFKPIITDDDDNIHAMLNNHLYYFRRDKERLAYMLCILNNTQKYKIMDANEICGGICDEVRIYTKEYHKYSIEDT